MAWMDLWLNSVMQSRSYGVVLWEIITGDQPDRLRGLRTPECALRCNSCDLGHGVLVRSGRCITHATAIPCSLPVLLLNCGAARPSCACSVPEECPQEVVELYLRCLSSTPAERPRAADIVDILLRLARPLGKSKSAQARSVAA